MPRRSERRELTARPKHEVAVESYADTRERRTSDVVRAGWCLACKERPCECDPLSEPPPGWPEEGEG